MYKLSLILILSSNMFAQIGNPAGPQLMPGAWKFVVGNTGAFIATLQVTQSGGNITGTFVSASGATFPGFTATMTPALAGWGSISLSWAAGNRDVPGVACTANGGTTPCAPVYTGSVAPDGSAMVGTYTLPIGAPSPVPWYAVALPPSAPTGAPTPAGAACTGSVQSSTTNSLLITGLRCYIAPASATGATVEFVGDAASQVSVTGNFILPAAVPIGQ